MSDTLQLPNFYKDIKYTDDEGVEYFLKFRGADEYLQTLSLDVDWHGVVSKEHTVEPLDEPIKHKDGSVTLKDSRIVFTLDDGRQVKTSNITDIKDVTVYQEREYDCYDDIDPNDPNLISEEEHWDQVRKAGNED